MELDFEQNPISKEGQYGIFDYIRTTFYSTSAEYEESFDTRIHIDGSKNNSIPQQVGSAITYFKRYALVGHLNIKVKLIPMQRLITIIVMKMKILHLIDKLVLIESKNKKR